MKKRWIMPIIALLLVAMLVGTWYGIRLETIRAENEGAPRDVIGDAVAVVNADTGVLVDGAMINYSAAIIQTLGEGYHLVSPAMAQNGFLNGIYSAILTFPSNVSERIIAFNAGHTERVQLEFVVNPFLPEAQYIDTYIQLLDLQMAINLTLAHTYISSILSQFHAGQDEVSAIFDNKNRNILALGYLDLHAFTESLILDAFPDFTLEINDLDTSEHLTAVISFAQDISYLYLDSYADAREAYLNMRVGLFELVDDFPDQKEAWLIILGDWIGITGNYSEEVIAYSDAVHEHRGNVDDLHEDLIEWHEDIGELRTDLIYWKSRLSEWYDDEDDRVSEVIDFLSDVETFVNAVESRRNSLTSELQDVYSDLDAWYDSLRALWLVFTAAAADFDAQEGSVNEINELLDYLRDWRDDLNTWQDTFGDFGVNFTAVSTLQTQIMAHFQGRPIRSGFATDELYETALVGWAGGFGNFNNPNLQSANWVGFGVHLSSIPGFPGPDPLPDDVEIWRFEGVVKPVAPDIAPFPDELPDFSEIGGMKPSLTADHAPPYYTGVGVPDVVGTIDPFTGIRPERPELDEPPEPDDFWDALDCLQDQLYEFNPYDFLTDDVRASVDGKITNYENYLSTIRFDLEGQFAENVASLLDVRFGYTEHLAGLRSAALEAESEEMYNLRNRIEAFREIANDSSDDTYLRLSDFSGMLPVSRTYAGVNREMIDFAVAPIELVQPVLRGDMITDNAAPLAFSVWWIWTAIGILAATILAAVLYSIYEVMKREGKSLAPWRRMG